MQARERLEEITELVEDFYGMFERYLRYAPQIVLEAPTLVPTMQFWHVVIFVQQKDAIEAFVAFIEGVLGLIADSNKGFAADKKAQYGMQLRAHGIQVCPGLVEAIFRLIAQVPIKYMREALPCILDGVRQAFPQEFPSWLNAGLMVLPPSAASQAEKMNIGDQIVRGDESTVYDAVMDICYRCEQVAMRSRGKQNS